jgi:predicted SprT family Zn-dependent metalloprotease
VDIDALVREAGRLLERHGLSGWRFGLSDRLKLTLGICDYRGRAIRINKYYAENNPEGVVSNTLRHEIAHALTPGHGHDEAWRAMAVRLGCKPRATCDEDVLLPPGRYVAVCPNCRYTHCKHRLHYQPPIHPYYCLPCGKERGVLVFTKGGTDRAAS